MTKKTMNASEFKERMKSCIDEIGDERIRVVSDDYYCDIHNVVDVRINKNNYTIEIVIG